ncbi:SH3 domain-containing protein [Streptomyces sp. NPDC048179]|uniref:SH3 domain-containing protein n=1 Tax=Streptomyces sp. NPDC048179 TaxID=3365506 RepID=UPI00371A176F
MSPRRPLARAVATAAATLALAALCATAPAHADDDWNTGDPGNGSYDDSGRPNGIGNSGNLNNPSDPNHPSNPSNPNDPNSPNNPNNPGDPNHPGNPSGNGSGRVVGVVTAQNGIWLLDRPDRNGGRVRFVRRGAEVFITCRTIGESVYGDRVWYRVGDGTWAWGPAHYIDTLGDTPRWC